MNVALHTRILSLCSGYGGIDLGVRLVEPDARTVCFVEREATVAAVLAARFADGTLEPAPIWSDVKTFDGRAWRGAVDLVTAGYPCQPFSVAGSRKGTKDPRHLWPQVARIIRECEPEWVFLENVGGHLQLGFQAVHAELGRMGYRVAAGLFTAEEVGAPHRRQRLFALANRGRGSITGRRITGNVAEAARGHEGEGLQRKRLRDTTCDGSADVANCAGAGRGELRQSSALAGRFAHGHGAGLADAGDGLVSLARRRSQARDGARPAVAQLAHARSVNDASSAGSKAGAGSGARAAAGRSGHVLADAKCQSGSAGRELHEVGRPLQTARSANRSRSVADAECAERRPHSQPARHSRQGRDDARQAAGKSEQRGLGLADADLARRSQRARGSAAGAHGHSEPGGLPVFCPGPAEHEAWRGLLREYPQVEPAIRGALDGTSSRVDRLRALGNGVVPLVAGHAYRSLREAFGY